MKMIFTVKTIEKFSGLKVKTDCGFLVQEIVKNENYFRLAINYIFYD